MRALIVYLTVISTALAFAGCQAQEPREAPGEAGELDTGKLAPAPVTFPTSDGWRIRATYWPGGEGKPAAILLHMLIADRHTYDDFGAKLAAAGFNVLALDSRGHGDSTQRNGETVKYDSFDEEAHRASGGDVAAAKAFLAEEGADTSQLVIVGASIGANFALNYAVSDEEVRAVVLLSPGLNYRGVTTEDAMRGYGPRPAYLVASDEDSYAAESVTTLHKLGAQAELKMFSEAGHGTRIFDAEPSFEDTLVEWLSAQVK